MIGIVFGVGISVVWHNPAVLILFSLMSIFIPFLLAVRTTLKSKSYKYIVGLTLMYIVYGFARSVCLAGVGRMRADRAT